MREYVNGIMWRRWYPKIEVEWEELNRLTDKEIRVLKKQIKALDFCGAGRDRFVEVLEEKIWEVKNGL